MGFYTSRLSARQNTPTYLVPPAHPGNLGDMLCLASALQLLQDFNPRILDLFSDLEPSMQNWSDYQDLSTATRDTIGKQIDGHEVVNIVYLAQDSIDSRYGDFHLSRLSEVITGLGHLGIECELTIWNATLSASYPLSKIALKLIKTARAIVFRDCASSAVLESYAIKNISQIFDLSTVYLLREKCLPDDKFERSGAIGLSMGHQILKYKQSISETYRELQLLPPNELLNLDSRVYPFAESDISSGLEIAKTLGVSLNSKNFISDIRFYSDLRRKLDTLKEVRLVQTSRYHVAIASLILERPVDLFAYNEKFNVLSQIWTQSGSCNRGSVSYSHIEPVLKNSMSLSDTLNQWKLASRNLQR
jgi:hypothetical protein